ncbi:30S ribosomal protein S6 [bacterium CG10_46_32]|nr:MAG: 30S ribosomal protein S6 [bacterium CG10_46_32]PIR56214.1 MAG: 30S ribosomal protein S6 [Parcubacteria group bacterium CG10_big_fil_rev_8_21_14_0_10_46_32]
MKPYELCVLFAGSIAPAELAENVKKVEQLLADAKIEVSCTHTIGRKKLAYTIAGQTHGEYLVWLFQAEPAVIPPLNGKLRLASFVVRHAIEKLEYVTIEERVQGLQDTKAGKSAARDEEEDEVEEEKSPVAHSYTKKTVEPIEHKKEEKKVSLEDLDEKLDEILESDKL